MDSRVAAALTGLLRAATAVEEELELIRGSNPRQGFPHEYLVDSLPRQGNIHDRTVSFGEELIALPPEYAVTTLTATSKQLASLHTASQALRSAVEWSSKFSAIDWWVARRMNELGLEDTRVLVAPGALGDFSIERTSRFREVLIEMGEGGRLLSDENQELSAEFHQYRDQLANIHLLKVPPSDGISPAWHPLVLGHEVAHLKYTDLAVREWTSQVPREGQPQLVDAAISAADSYAGKTGVQLVTRSSWLHQLERWLTEIACDTVAVAFYGSAGRNSLMTILTSYAVPGASASHPPPELRIAIQDATVEADLHPHLSMDDPFASAETQATAALISLAIPLREHVRAGLAETVGPNEDVARAVASTAHSDLASGLLPSSNEWPEGDVSSLATAIESGLVRGLWQQYQFLSQTLPYSEPAVRRTVDFVSQAIDAVEFAARFDATRIEAGVEAEERMPIPNVLWLSAATGVHTSPPPEQGTAAHDLRLGRHFIVFQRSAISDINSLGSQVKVSAIQRAVEVGWGDEFVLHPSELVLAATFEALRLDETCFAQVLSRSSLGRLGLLSATAVQVQPGYRGCLTLELVNLANVPLRLTPGQRVAQIVPFPAGGNTAPYAGSYQDSGAKPEFSLSRNDWEAEVLRRMRSKAL